MTRTPRFLKPKKLGLDVESWLKHDVLGTACTANVCLYFFDALKVGDVALLDSSIEIVPRGAPVGNSWLVVTAVSIKEAMFAAVSGSIDRCLQREQPRRSI